MYIPESYSDVVFDSSTTPFYRSEETSDAKSVHLELWTSDESETYDAYFFYVDSWDLVGWLYEGSGTVTHQPIMQTQLFIRPQRFIYTWSPTATPKTPTPNQYAWYYGPVTTMKPLIQHIFSIVICDMGVRLY